MSVTIPNTPVVNPGLLYVNGFNLTRASSTTITATSGSARNSTNVNDIISSSTLTFTGTTVGANGMDVAVIGASTMYYLYAIGDSTGYQATALLGSTSATPSLPYNYDMYRRIGFFLTSGASAILQFWQFGEGQTRAMYYDVGISELSGGSATSFTAIDLATSVPPLATQVILDVAYTPNSATNDAEFLPFGSSATNGIVRFGCGVAAAQNGQVVVPCRLDSGVPKIQYKVAASDSLTLLTVGYYDYLT